jgi:biotin synthase
MDIKSISELLLAQGREQEVLFKKALQKSYNIFEGKVYTRGVIEISNYCALNCHYCGMRKNNKSLNRYRLPPDMIIEKAKLIKKIGVNSIMLQSGDDYSYRISELVQIVKHIKEVTGSHIILCLGERKVSDFEKLKEAGANMYILKLEMFNHQQFKYLRPRTSLERRIKLLKSLREIGYELSSGFIVGLPGQTIEELAEGILYLKEMEVENISVSPFIPNSCSPLSGENYGDLNLSLNAVAVMRLLFNKVNIPSVSAFSMLDPMGQVRAFKAGANVITINFSDKNNIKDFVIYDTERKLVSLDSAVSVIQQADLSSSLNPKLLSAQEFLTTKSNF